MRIISSLILMGLLSTGVFASSRPSSFPGVNKNKLLITLYYESMCPDSKKFVTNQLYPLYKEIPNYLDLEFVPYGIAETTSNPDGTFTFTCQHGPDECRGNKLHACAIAKLSPTMSAAFINCSMSQQRPHEAGQLCASLLHLESELNGLIQCARGSEGSHLLYGHGLHTRGLNPSLYWVPWPTYDGVFYEEDLDPSQIYLLPVVCKHLSDAEQKPPACNQFDYVDE